MNKSRNLVCNMKTKVNKIVSEYILDQKLGKTWGEIHLSLKVQY